MSTASAVLEEPKRMTMLPPLEPWWFDGYGAAMQVAELDVQHGALSLKSPQCTSLRIAREGSLWQVRWRKHIETGRLMVSGKASMNTHQIRRAFSLTEVKDPSEQEALAHFGGDAAVMGKFIRQDRLLKIPCPGVGAILDPAVCVHINREIQDAVRRLIGC